MTTVNGEKLNISIFNLPLEYIKNEYPYEYEYLKKIKKTVEEFSFWF